MLLIITFRHLGHISKQFTAKYCPTICLLFITLLSNYIEQRLQIHNWGHYGRRISVYLSFHIFYLGFITYPNNSKYKIMNDSYIFNNIKAFSLLWRIVDLYSYKNFWLLELWIMIHLSTSNYKLKLIRK